MKLYSFKVGVPHVMMRLLLALLVVANSFLCAAAETSLFKDFIPTAVIQHPVVDMGSNFPVPVSPAVSPDANKCGRAHQGFYNTCVQCFQEYGDQVMVRLKHIVYGLDVQTKEPKGDLWVDKKHLILLQNLSPELLKVIPSCDYGQEPIVVLKYPWNNFSVGTRFRHVPERDTADAFGIERIDYARQIIIGDLIPRADAIEEIKREPHDARKLFVQLINELVDRVAAHGVDQVIPYVWGGCSFIKPYNKQDFFREDGVWQRQGKKDPYSGYDCSQFIRSMAQIAGVDFPWKTSAVMAEGLKRVDPEKYLEDGDIIHVPGHVMAVSNMERNELIEARGYGDGYGCVQRISLGECFDGIETYEDLLYRYYANQEIRFKNKQGEVIDKPRKVTLLKLTQ